MVEKDIPQPGPRQVRMKVQACGICHGDSITKDGLFPGIEYPRTPGYEIAGIIDKVGNDVNEWKVEERVAVGWYCGHLSRGSMVRLSNAPRCNEYDFI